MSYIRLKSLSVRNYRSFGNESQTFNLDPCISKPLAIVGYNNVGKTNLLNCIKYGLFEKISEEKISAKEFHNFDISKNIDIKCRYIFSLKDKTGKPLFSNNTDGEVQHADEIICDGGDIYIKETSKYFPNNAKEYDYNYKYKLSKTGLIYHINFHKIKEEISTQKTSWGNLKSFLAKHIKKLTDQDKSDINYEDKKVLFELVNRDNVATIVEDSLLSKFISRIKANYCTNLRDNNCEILFGLPEYDDIFLQMMFKIGLNGEKDKLVPIDHFGDGYISMFIMAVIQAIAEEISDDKSIFLFEEPESFLHENHQEYFYKTVLCGLAEKGHQVIYTTHSDKMVDITEPTSIIRLSFDSKTQQSKKVFPSDSTGIKPLTRTKGSEIVVQFNSFIKSIEPNLNKIIFSDKVILVEGPNDLLVYNYLIRKKVEHLLLGRADIQDKAKYAETFLNFNNIAIVPHHGKSTAYILADLCKYLGVDYYLINDWDFVETELDINDVKSFETDSELHESNLYISQVNIYKKGMITTNWKLLKCAKNNQIHFNIDKLEKIIGYNSEDKNAINIWKQLSKRYSDSSKIGFDIFPNSLSSFIGLDNIIKTDIDPIKIIANPEYDAELINLTEELIEGDAQMPFEL